MCRVQFDHSQSAVREDPLSGAELCLPIVISYIGEYSQDSELVQNLLDVLSILVKDSYYKGNEGIVAKNVECLFKNSDTIQILFAQFSSDDMYSCLVVIDILKCSLKVNRVRFRVLNHSLDFSWRLHQPKSVCASATCRLPQWESRGNSKRSSPCVTPSS